MNGVDRDRLFDLLGALPAASPTAASTEHLRARCHAALTEPHHATEPSDVKAVGITGLLLCVFGLYLAAALAEALRFLALRP
jgi:hypothetical protein